MEIITNQKLLSIAAEAFKAGEGQTFWDAASLLERSRQMGRLALASKNDGSLGQTEITVPYPSPNACCSYDNILSKGLDCQEVIPPRFYLEHFDDFGHYLRLVDFCRDLDTGLVITVYGTRECQVYAETPPRLFKRDIRPVKIENICDADKEYIIDQAITLLGGLHADSRRKPGKHRVLLGCANTIKSTPPVDAWDYANENPPLAIV